MATGLIAGAADDLLDELASTYTYVQLHVGDPGAAGTNNPANEDTRAAVSWAAASGGTLASGADVTWSSVAGSETYSHFSVWSAATSGTCGFTGSISANPVTAGDTFVIPAGDLTASLDVAS